MAGHEIEAYAFGPRFGTHRFCRQPFRGTSLRSTLCCFSLNFLCNITWERTALRLRGIGLMDFLERSYDGLHGNGTVRTGTNGIHPSSRHLKHDVNNFQ